MKTWTQIMRLMASGARASGRKWHVILPVLGLGLLLEFMLRVQTGVFLSSPTLTTVKFGRSTTEAVGVALFCAILAAERAAAVGAAAVKARFNFYSFLFSIINLSLVVWVIEARSDKWVPVEYMLAGVIIAVLFLGVATRATVGPLHCIRHVLDDISGAARMPTTWFMLGIAVVAIGWAPIPETEAIQSGTAFRGWFLSQKRIPLPDRPPQATVVVTEFVDYQCPYSRMAAGRFGKVFDELAARYGAQFRVVYHDFPLDTSCNVTKGVSSVHPAACDAAVAVRLARAEGRGAAMVQWLWAHQDGLSRASIQAELKTLIPWTGDVDAKYESAREELTRDIAVGAAVPVKQTPTFVINGVVTPLVSAKSMRWAVEHEMTAHGVASTAPCMNIFCGGESLR